MPRFIKKILVIPIAFFILFGYDVHVVLSEAEVAVEQALTNRAMQRWNALINQDFNQVYEFENPGFRQVNPKEKYRSFYGSAIKWEKAQVTKVSLSSDHLRAKLNVKIDYDGPTPEGQSYKGQMNVEDTWIWVDNQWWFIRY